MDKKINNISFYNVFYNSPVGIGIVNEKGEILETNPSFAKTLKLKENKLSNINSLINFNELKQYRKYKGIISSGCSNIFSEITISKINNNIFSVHIQDFTDNIQTKNDLSDKVSIIEEKKQELERLAYVASHDLQEPLRTISNYIQLFSSKYKDIVDPKAEKYIKYILDANDRMRKLIRDLLEFSRAGESYSEPEETTLEEIIEEVKNSMKVKIRQAKAHIKMQNEKTKFVCDKFQMIRVFQNLVSNSIKFKSNKKPRIKITCTEKCDHLLFTVKDNGVGIKEKYYEKIFVMFERGLSKNAKNVRGNGIGLAVCKRIIEKHNGKIWVEKEVNEGTTFHFTIPKQREKKDNEKNSNC